MAPPASSTSTRSSPPSSDSVVNLCSMFSADYTNLQLFFSFIFLLSILCMLFLCRVVGPKQLAFSAALGFTLGKFPICGMRTATIPILVIME